MRILTQKFWTILLILITCCACNKEIDKYYERPKFLKGNAYEFLQGRGNFTFFLQAAELAGYDNILKGRGLCTAMVPTDEAFKAWLQKHNYATLSDVPLADLNVLVGYHLIQNAYEEDFMLGFYKELGLGQTQGDGLCYKFKTFATAPSTTRLHPVLGSQVTINSRQKFLPVISTRLFEANKCTNFEDNYKYFFPDVNWQGNQEKLHAGNAAVIETSIPTDNGYVYILDKVADPLRTVYEAIQKPASNNFSDFLKIYDRFAELSSPIIKQGDTSYYYNHLRIASTQAKPMLYSDELPCLASEWAYHDEMNTSSTYYDFYMRYTYNCFTPTNIAMETFFQRYFNGFRSIEEVPQLTLYYLLRNHVKEKENLLLPEVFERSGIKGDMGEKWDITRSNIVEHEFCANGILYGIDQVFVPILFEIVAKPLFTTPDFAIMANMFFKTDQFSSLVDPTPERFTLLVMADTLLANQYQITFDNGDSYFNDKNEKIKKGNVDLSMDQMTTTATSNIVLGTIRDFNKRAFYATRNPYTYVYTDDGTMHGENGTALQILKTWETVNGLTYQVNSMLTKNDMNAIEYLKNMRKDFYDLLVKAKLILTKDKVDYFAALSSGERFIIFAPENGILDKTALQALPEADLKSYLNYFFVSLDINAMSDYILPNYGNPQTVKTLQEDKDKTTIYQKNYTEINIGFSGNSLSLQNQAQTKTILTNGDLPFFATDGLIYGITETIQPK